MSESAESAESPESALLLLDWPDVRKCRKCPKSRNCPAVVLAGAMRRCPKVPKVPNLLGSSGTFGSGRERPPETAARRCDPDAVRLQLDAA